MNIHRAQFTGRVYRRDDFLGGRRLENVSPGRSIVGKFSATSRLLKQQRPVRVSATPVRTRAIHLYLIHEAFYVVDLLDHGYAHVPEKVRQAWKALVEDSVSDRPQIVLGLLAVDARNEPSPLDLRRQDCRGDAGIPYVVLLTKSQQTRPVGSRVGDWVGGSRFSRSRGSYLLDAQGLGVPGMWQAIRSRFRLDIRIVNSDI